MNEMICNIIKGVFSIVAIIAISASTTFGQQNDDYPKMPTSKKESQKLYERNIKKSRINGVYIPKNLNEAFYELDALSPVEAKAKFKNASEEIVSKKLHFGLGRWIQIYWNFEEGSRYVEYLKSIGLTDFDHMIQFTIVSYHRYMNNRPLEIEERVEKYKVEREKFLEKERNRGTVIHSETRKIKKP